MGTAPQGHTPTPAYAITTWCSNTGDCTTCDYVFVGKNHSNFFLKTLVRAPPMAHTRDMNSDNTLLWSLPTLTLFVVALNHIGGGALFSTVSTFLSANGF